ncbi:MAG: hypothetical protein JOY64_01230 [Alphaproteobacteria bacterium]|nr:hypothetical protein [Alphaproteobacteria bacterium]
MPSLLQIVAHTPLWVWAVMAAIVALGLYGLRPRVLPPRRLAILPLVGVVLSLAGIVQSAQPALAFAAWSLALLAGLPPGHALGRRREARWLEDGRLEIAGGWFMLVFALSIFAVRYALGVVFGIAPALKADPVWIGLSAGAGGLIAGIGLGWLAGLVLRARPTAAAAR